MQYTQYVDGFIDSGIIAQKGKWYPLNGIVWMDENNTAVGHSSWMNDLFITVCNKNFHISTYDGTLRRIVVKRGERIKAQRDYRISYEGNVFMTRLLDGAYGLSIMVYKWEIDLGTIVE